MVGQRLVADRVVIGPVGTPAELLERALALVVAGGNLNLPEADVKRTPAYREVQLRILWWPVVHLTEASARVIVAATS